MRNITVGIVLIASCASVALCAACDEAALEGPGAEPSALVITTDRETGAYSVIRLADRVATNSVNAIHSDAVCRFDPITGLPFVISRLGADAIEVLDPSNGWGVSMEYSVGAGTNAQDIAVVSSDRAYVARFADPALLVVHPTEGTEIGTVDLSAYADADGLPEATQLYQLDGEVFVLLQRIDETWTPTEYSSLLVLDGATGVVDDHLQLTATNPTGKLRFSQAVQRLVLLESGAYGTLDGGIEYFDPVTRSLSGLVVTEQTLGGDVVDAVIVSASKGYAVIGILEGDSATTRLVSFDPGTGAKLDELIVSNGWDLSYLELTPDGTELWVADRTPEAPGIRIFDVDDDAETTSGPIDVGLPPSMVCFVE